MKRLGLVVIFGSMIVALAVFWWRQALLPVDPKNNIPITFVIAKGDGVREVVKNLKSAGLTRDPIALFLLIKFMGIETNIQAGSYRLAPSLFATDLAKNLTLGTEDIWVTIPEGRRFEEIMETLKDKNINGQALATAEGQYFPDTYLVPKEITADGFLLLMLANFTKKVPAVTKEQLIIASLVEREAKTMVDRPLVASVIFNRLRTGMALDIDATIQYALGKPGNWWPKDLTTDDLKIKSLYNTYRNPGLPPGPICNPGLSAIEAAINPAKTDYYFYISDKAGAMHFAKTLAEHNLNIAKYLQ